MDDMQKIKLGDTVENWSIKSNSNFSAIKDAVDEAEEDISSLEGNKVDKTTTIAGVDLQDNITKSELQTALNVADGSQANVIEKIQKNGTDLEITSKTVNIAVPTTAGDVGAYTKAETEEYVAENGGKIDKIQKNGTDLQIINKVVNITVPTTAGDVNALPSSTKYGASLDLTIDSTTYVITIQLKDQDGNNIGQAKTVDLPLESIITSATYYATYTYEGTTYSKVIVLILSTTSVPTIIPVGDLVSGLQSEITITNKLDADLVDDSSSTNKFVSASDKSSWNGAVSTIGGYGDIVSHDADEFATATQGGKADTAVQPDDLATVATSGSYSDLLNLPTLPNGTYIGTSTNWGTSTTVSYLRTNYFSGGQIPQKEGDLVYSTGTRNLHRCGAVTWDSTENCYKTTPTFVANFPNPTVNDATLTIQKEGTEIGTFSANASSNEIVNIEETDPVFSASAAAGITSSDIDNWDAKSDFSGDYNDLSNKPDIPKVYNSISNISDVLTTSSTMLQVMLAMANNSKLIADVSTYPNLYPDSNYTAGLLEIEKVNVNRATARYTAKANASSTDCLMWYGEFQNAQSGYEWSGWHQVLNGSLDQTVGGVKTFSSAPTLNNNIFLKGKFTGGTAYDLIGVNSGNGVAVGNTSTGLILNTSSNVIPSANNTKNMGSPTAMWNTLYATNINDGTNSVTVENIVNANQTIVLGEND